MGKKERVVKRRVNSEAKIQLEKDFLNKRGSLAYRFSQQHVTVQGEIWTQ
jgi:hypothetical protein